VTGAGETATAGAVVGISIGGAHLQATARDPRLRLALSATARRFACPPAVPDFSATVDLADLSGVRFGDRLLFDSGALWQLWRQHAGYTLRLASPYYGAAPYKMVHLDEGWTRAEILVHSGYTAEGLRDPFEYPLDELWITHWLAGGRGLELHASGVVDERGDGYLFCGQSGAGKSTTARAWLGARPGTVLSDDRIIVRLEAGRFWMYGTPWHGDAALAAAARAPVRAVLLLKQAPRTRLVSLPASEAVARLLACAFFPLYDAAAIGFGMDCAAELVRRVPCCELELERGPKFLDVIAAL
jgi:hypothetical protein